ncbi:hypothetical protein [Citrobacter freundii]|uniref:hypothetical protein n=1 Tax=Citrobacter freundii TaxID=546 RepID=UPI003C6F28C6
MKNLATWLLAAAFTTAALPAFAVEPSVQVGYSPEGGVSGNPRKFAIPHCGIFWGGGPRHDDPPKATASI